MPGSKTAKTIATGVWWRIGAAGVARSSNGKCFTLERSTTVSTKVGAERSKSSMRKPSGPCPWRYFLLIGSYPTSPRALACRSGSDCVQVVIGLIVTPEGFPLAYEVLPGNRQIKPRCVDSCAGPNRHRASGLAKSSWNRNKTPLL